jgi:hypothetical protein
MPKPAHRQTREIADAPLGAAPADAPSIRRTGSVALHAWAVMAGEHDSSARGEGNRSHDCEAVQ